MSNWREQFSEESETQAMATWLEKYYHIPVLVVLVSFILWNRLRNYGNFIIDGTVYLSGNDPWYHLRMTEYTVNNFPSTMPFDPWTYFPHGTSVGQFGTLFDQVIALVALVLGLGSPSESLVRQVFLVAPPFFAVLVCIPGYFIGKRLGGRLGGLIVVAMVALVPDRLMLVTLAGNVQHHSFEVLFMSLSILGLMAALSHAEREKPIYELVGSRDFDTMRNTIGYSMLAGVAMAMYVWTWPPAMWIFGILSIFFIVHMSLEHLHGRSPEHSAFVGVISMSTAGLLILSTTRTLELAGVTSRSLLQPGLAFASVAGIVFLAWLSRELDSRQLSRSVYPVTVAGAIVLTLGLMALLLPELFSFLSSQVDRVFGFVTAPGETAGTVGEVQPMEFSQLSDTYYIGLFTAGAGAAIVLLKQALDSGPRAEELLVVLWGIMMLLATLTQTRFAYYMTIVVGALNALLIGYIFQIMGNGREFEFETYQVLTVAVVVLVVFVPFLGLPVISADVTPTAFADGNSYPGDVVAWDDSLQFMNENTPEPGQFGHPDNEPMELFGEFEETDDFDYPDGAYGVMSWWDYGHWITQRGERIPNANPFQAGASEAAEFLLAQDEEEALAVLSELDDHDEAQTRFVMIDWRMVEPESARPVRGKFFAPPVFHSEYQQHDFTRQYMHVGERGQLQPLARVQTQAYYNSMMTRLYHYHGSDHEPQPVVVEWVGDEREFDHEGLEGQAYLERPPEGQDRVIVFNSIHEAREYVTENPSAQIGGLGAMPEERVEGLEHFRLVHMSETTAIPQTTEDRLMAQHGVNLAMQLAAQQSTWNTGFGQALMEQMFEEERFDEEAQQAVSTRALNMMYPTTPAFTKTFERVPGATIEGTGPANELVEVSVRLNPENGNPFTYERLVTTDDDGHFELTVPYATTGYDEYGVEEGYTEPAVEAEGAYTIRTVEPEHTEDDEIFFWETTAEVTEGQVIGEEPGPVTVELEREQLELGQEDADSENGDGDTGDGGTDEGADDESEEGESGESDADESEDGESEESNDESGETDSASDPVGFTDTVERTVAS